MRLARLPVGLALAMLFSACAARAQTPDGNGLHFVADNAATASTAAISGPLVQTQLVGMDGAPSARTVALPAGFSMRQVAAGLRNPRFMAFDEQGNLLVADAAAGSVYRYPAANGSIAPSAQPPAALVTGLEAPSNVALYGGRPVYRRNAHDQPVRLRPGGGVGTREVVVAELPRGGHSTRTVRLDPTVRCTCRSARHATSATRLTSGAPPS